MFQPLQGKALASVALADARMNVWEGSVRSGKTISSIIAWLKFIRTAPTGDLMMVGRTRDTIYRNVITVIIQMIGDRARYNRGTGELTIGGRKIWVLGANDAQAESKIRGLTLIGAYVDEATILPESFWRMLGTRLSLAGAKLFATTNPDNPKHWLKKSYLDNAKLHLRQDGTVVRNEGDRLDLARFSFQLSDNPSLSAEYLRALELEYNGLWRKRFILGEWVVAEGAIYDMWDDQRHVVPHSSIPNMTHTIIFEGIDYGTRNPFVALLIGMAEQKLWVMDQYRWDSAARRAQRTSGQYSADLKEFHAGRVPAWIYVDPSAAEFRQQMFNDGHPGVMAADNSVVDGIRTVSTLLSMGKLLISDRCTGLIQYIPGYVWDEKAAAKGEDRPVKVDDHDPDALRYGVHSAGWLWRHHLGVSESIGGYRETADAA